MIERWPFSKLALAAIEGVGFPAAVAERPRAGGWTGEVNVSPFVPYAVLIPQTANASSGPISDAQADWKLPYTVATFTLEWDQCERVADRVRAALAGMVRAQVASSTGSYRVIKVNLTTIGQVNRSDQTDPPFYTQTDAFEVWANKEPS